MQHRLREILASAGDDQIQRGQVLSLLAASHFHRQEWALAAEKFAESVEVLQMLPAGSELWLDGGHNPAAGVALAEALGRLPTRPRSSSWGSWPRPLRPPSWAS